MFTIKENYKMIEGVNPWTMPLKLLWNSRVPPKSEVLCLRSLVGKDSNHGAIEEEGLSYGKQVPCVVKLKRIWTIFWSTTL